jgi:hypothetical protein
VKAEDASSRPLWKYCHIEIDTIPSILAEHFGHNSGINKHPRYAPAARTKLYPLCPQSFKQCAPFVRVS